MTEPMKELAERIDQCAAIMLVGSDGVKGYLPVGSPKIISAALRAASHEAGLREALALIKEAKDLLALAYKATGYKSKINSAVWRLTYAERALAKQETGT
jgi:hypothetical protein